MTNDIATGAKGRGGPAGEETWGPGSEARPGAKKTKRQVGIGVAFGVGAGGVDVVRPAVPD
jgi:hypothetical protein